MHLWLNCRRNRHRSVVGPVAGVYHGYQTEIANHCLLGEYGIASQVVHLTSGSPLGPWARRA